MATGPYNPNADPTQYDREADAQQQQLERQRQGLLSNPGSIINGGIGNLHQTQAAAQQAADNAQRIRATNYGGSASASQGELQRLGGIAGQYNTGAMGSWDQGQGSRLSQQDALGLMQQAAYGNAPSVAAIQQQQGMDAAMRNQMAMAAGARGAAGLAGAQYNAASNTGAMQQSAIGQASALRAQEMAQARGMYGQMASGIRGQDIGSAMGQGQMGIGYEGLGQNINMANMRGQQGQSAQDQAKWEFQQGQKAASDAAMMSNITGAVGMGAGLIAGMPPGLGSLSAPKAPVPVPAPAPGGIGSRTGSSNDPSQYGYY